jgi:HPt (histidine-containing phosphotransfer) domain-containing protein
MDDFIVKPFDTRALVACILRLLRPPDAALAVAQNVAQTAALAGEPGPSTPPDAAEPPWPEIEGIDAADARSRASGDQALFRSILERLIGEFSDLATPAPTDDAAALARHAARMHKLRGSAGMLGATSIHQLAGEAEAACRGGDVDRAAHFVTRLVTQMQRLADAAAPLLEAARAPPEVAEPPADVDLDPAELADFVSLLRQQSLGALDRFSALSAGLRTRLGPAPYQVVRDHVHNLRFAEAVKALEAVPPG